MGFFMGSINHKKKSPTFVEDFKYFNVANYFLNLAYLVLNLSIRPAVSTILVLPV